MLYFFGSDYRKSNRRISGTILHTTSKFQFDRVCFREEKRAQTGVVVSNADTDKTAVSVITDAHKTMQLNYRGLKPIIGALKMNIVTHTLQNQCVLQIHVSRRHGINFRTATLRCGALRFTKKSDTWCGEENGFHLAAVLSHRSGWLLACF